jgi:hypothetical protein
MNVDPTTGETSYAKGPDNKPIVARVTKDATDNIKVARTMANNVIRDQKKALEALETKRTATRQSIQTRTGAYQNSSKDPKEVEKDLGIYDQEYLQARQLIIQQADAQLKIQGAMLGQMGMVNTIENLLHPQDAASPQGNFEPGTIGSLLGKDEEQ